MKNQERINIYLKQAKNLINTMDQLQNDYKTIYLIYNINFGVICGFKSYEKAKNYIKDKQDFYIQEYYCNSNFKHLYPVY